MVKARQAVMWIRGSTQTTCFFIRPEGTTDTTSAEGVIQYIMKESNWGCVDATDKSKFIKDALSGRVVIATGKNIKREEYKFQGGELYTSGMHSLNNFKEAVYTAQAGGSSGYGWAYLIQKQRALNESELNTVKEIQKTMEDFNRIDRVYNLIRTALALKQYDLPLRFIGGEGDDYGRKLYEFDYYTSKCHNYPLLNKTVESIDKVVTDMYNIIKDLTGYDVIYDGEDCKTELPESFMCSRYASNKNIFVRENGKEHKSMAEVLDRLIADNVIPKVNCVEHYNDKIPLIEDDSILILSGNDYNTSGDLNYRDFHLHADYFKDLPECMVVAEKNESYQHGDYDYFQYLVLWGDSKTTYEMMGASAFFKLVTKK